MKTASGPRGKSVKSDPPKFGRLTAIGDQRGDHIATVGKQEEEQAGGGRRHRRGAQENDRGAKAPVGEEDEDEREGGQQDGGLGEQREPQQAPGQGGSAAVVLAHREQDQPESRGAWAARSSPCRTRAAGLAETPTRWRWSGEADDRARSPQP